MRRILQFFFLLFLSIVATSCSENRGSKAEQSYPVKPLSIPGDNGDDWGDGDLAISITNISENDSGKVYKAISRYKNEDLGLEIFIPHSNSGDKGFGDGITLKSIGKQSDRLLELLANLYKQKLPVNSKFVNSISVGYVDLSEFAKSLGDNVSGNEPGAIEYKLFFKTKDNEAELYLNIKPKEQLVEIKEKDQEYRPTIIKVFEAN